MQPVGSLDDNLSSIEGHLVMVEQTLEHQRIAIARLQDELAEANRRADWYHVQFSDMLRVMARDTRELRAALICSIVSDGPINAQVIHSLLRETPDDQRELEANAAPQRTDGHAG